MEVARHAQSMQNRKLVILLQYIKKVLQLLLCATVMQNIQISYGGPVMFVFTCFTGKLEEDDGATMFFIAEKQQKTILNFF